MSGATRRPAVFLDKDGTLVENIPYNVDPARLRITARAVDGLRLLRDHGYALLVVTNQPGLAAGLFDRDALDRAHAALYRMLALQGVHIEGFFVCPHAPMASRAPGCTCRKPQPGLLREAAAQHGIDLTSSWMVGDILNDVEAGHRAGCRAILMDVGNETEWEMSSAWRVPFARVPDLHEAAQVILKGQDHAPAERRTAGGRGQPIHAGRPSATFHRREP
jgi:histidinol-phosphate phosphatase family protein